MCSGFLHIFICIIFRSDGKVEEIEFIICSIYFEFLNAKINIKHRNKFVFSVTRQCLLHSGQATYLSSANLLICLLSLSQTATIFKLLFRSFAAVKSKVADVRRNDYYRN